MLSAEAGTFLRSSIRSIWALEALKCLRSDPSRGWTADALRVELRASELAIHHTLLAFRAAGLVTEGAGTVRYHPASVEIDAIAGEIVGEYERRPIALMKEIYIPETRKIQDFADAFRIKTEDT